MNLPRLLRHALRAAAVVVVVLVFPVGAWAASCSDKRVEALIQDAYKDDDVDGTFARACYEEALDNLPADIVQYSNVGEVLRAKLAGLGANEEAPPTLPPAEPTEGTTEPDRFPADTPDTPTTSGPDVLPEPPVGSGGDGGPVEQLLDVGRSSDPDDVPLPVIVLGALAVLLVLGGGASLIVRRRLERRDGLL